MLISPILPSPINSGLQWTPVDFTEIYLYMYNIAKMWWTPVDSGDTFVSPLSFLWVYHWSPVESSDIRGGGGGKVLAGRSMETLGRDGLHRRLLGGEHANRVLLSDYRGSNMKTIRIVMGCVKSNRLIPVGELAHRKFAGLHQIYLADLSVFFFFF